MWYVCEGGKVLRRCLRGQESFTAVLLRAENFCEMFVRSEKCCGMAAKVCDKFVRVEKCCGGACEDRNVLQRYF